jgi:hypothetical protein
MENHGRCTYFPLASFAREVLLVGLQVIASFLSRRIELTLAEAGLPS